ncbi:MAG: hypothetical protein ACLS20_15175 [Faecalimonas umbilicata]|uniref:hypothetical protein n=1 Tax=Faecalimonas umbilicata TaxID=1912855 RepID=UPI0039942993
MTNSSNGLKEQPFLDIIFSIKEKAVFKQIRILKRSVMTMIFDFEPWQLDIDIDLTKQLYRSCKGDFVWVEKK